MSKRVTNEVLAEKIDNLTDKFADIRTDVKDNTKFRLQARGFISGVAALSSMVGGAIVLIFTKVFK